MSLRFRRLLGAALLAVSIAGQSAADPLPQSQISFTAGSSGTWNADWMGVEDRVYFFQWSLDLDSWNYAPFMDFGDGLKSHGCTSTSQKFFVRLRYVDGSSAESLEEAEDADFDGDGHSNLAEIATIGSDPLNELSVEGDVDADGLDDAWEMFYFDTLSQGAYDDPDRDWLFNFEEFELESDPTFQDGDLDLWLDSDELAYFGHLYEAGSDDFDSDGITNADETMIHGSDPTLSDTNGDEIPDGMALQLGIGIAGPDSDGDGLSNEDELAAGTNPGEADTDGDGVSDGLDALPLDPNAWEIPSGSGVAGAPVVSVFSPLGAVPVP